MDEEFPIGSTLAGNAFIIEEHIRGEPARGMYRARDRRGTSPGPLLVTVGTQQQRLFRDIARDLALSVEGITPVRHVGPLVEYDEAFHALVEDEPPGAPSTALPLPLPPPAALALALDVGQVLSRAHEDHWLVPYLRPELIYAEKRAGAARLTAMAPRAEMFLAGAVPASPGVPPLFDAIYAAPEVLALAPPSPEADVFALSGCLAYWVTGEPPFVGDTPLSQLTALHQGARRPWRGPANLGAVVARGLERDPARRPTLPALMKELSRLAARGT